MSAKSSQIKNRIDSTIALNGKPKAEETKQKGVAVSISPPNWKTVQVKIIGTSPYVQSKFSNKNKQQMMEKQKAGTQAAVKSRKREARDFKADYENSKYDSGNNWSNGAIPATSIRAAMIGAGRLIDFTMTLLKQCIYVEADGYDVDDRTPLIPVSKGKPTCFEQALPNTGGGHDIRVRPLWESGWECIVRIRYDADRLTMNDVVNLLARAGEQVGIGEGRMASRKCAGIGWGAFRIGTHEEWNK
jgi:hypothetical protein